MSLMYLIIHIIIALLSLGAATLAFFGPSQNKLKASYTLAGGTFVSGVLLIIAGGSLVHACISGITFLGAVSALNELTRRKLAAQNL